MSISTIAAKVIGEKKRWRDYKARVRMLPEPYHGVVEAFERYLMVAGGVVHGESAASLFENLVDLFEQSAGDGTPIREIVGDDPIEFIEAFLRNYPEGDWRSRERQRLISAIDQAAADKQ